MISSKDYMDAIRPLVVERQARVRRTRTLEVLDHAKFGGPAKTAFGSLGSMILFLARTEQRLDEAKRALKSGAPAMKKLMAQVESEMSPLKPRSFDEAIEIASRETSFGALTYGGTSIVDPLFLPAGLDLTVIGIPYSGGRLIRQGFALVEYVADPQTAGLFAFVLKTNPELTTAEKSALSLVPREFATIHVGPAYTCEFTTIMATAGAVAGAVAGGALTGPGGMYVGAAVGLWIGGGIDGMITHELGRMHPLSTPRNLDTTQLRELGPTLSARKLVSLRVEAMREASLKAIQ